MARDHTRRVGAGKSGSGPRLRDDTSANGRGRRGEGAPNHKGGEGMDVVGSAENPGFSSRRVAVSVANQPNRRGGWNKNCVKKLRVIGSPGNQGLPSKDAWNFPKNIGGREMSQVSSPGGGTYPIPPGFSFRAARPSKAHTGGGDPITPTSATKAGEEGSRRGGSFIILFPRRFTGKGKGGKSLHFDRMYDQR